MVALHIICLDAAKRRTLAQPYSLIHDGGHDRRGSWDPLERRLAGPAIPVSSTSGAKRSYIWLRGQTYKKEIPTPSSVLLHRGTHASRFILSSHQCVKSHLSTQQWSIPIYRRNQRFVFLSIIPRLRFRSENSFCTRITKLNACRYTHTPRFELSGLLTTLTAHAAFSKACHMESPSAWPGRFQRNPDPHL